MQPQRGEKARPLDLLVMENVFYDRALHPVYDLKGSTRARYVPDDPSRADIVLLDENLLESSTSSPILVRQVLHRHPLLLVLFGNLSDLISGWCNSYNRSDTQIK